MTTIRRQTSSPSNGPARDEPPTVPPAPVLPPQPREREVRTMQTERIGDILRRAREKRGDDLQQIADYLCIRRSFLVALENSNYEEFPADAYVIGFLRSYANLLGLDGKEAIDRYRGEMAGRRKKPVLFMPTPVTEGRTPSALIMIGAAVAALLIYIVWYGLSSSDRATVNTPPPLPTTTTSTETTSTAAVVLPPPSEAIAAPAPAAAAPKPTGQVYGNDGQEHHVVIRAEQTSWILIADSKGQTVFDHVLKAGDVYKVPGTDGLTLTTGNGAGLVLALDGIELPKLTGSSRVLRNISLSRDRLKSLPSTPAE